MKEPDECFVVAPVIGHYELLEIMVPFLPSSRSIAKQCFEVIEICLIHRVPNFVGSGDMSSQSEEDPELMLGVLVVSLEITEPIDQVVLRDSTGRDARFGQRDTVELDSDDFSEGLHRVDIRLGTPLHIRHEIRARGRLC